MTVPATPVACPSCGGTDQLWSLEQDVSLQRISGVARCPDDGDSAGEPSTPLGQYEVEWGYTETWGEPLSTTVGVRCGECDWYWIADEHSQTTTQHDAEDPWAALAPVDGHCWAVINGDGLPLVDRLTLAEAQKAQHHRALSAGVCVRWIPDDEPADVTHVEVDGTVVAVTTRTQL